MKPVITKSPFVVIFSTHSFRGKMNKFCACIEYQPTRSDAWYEQCI